MTKTTVYLPDDLKTAVAAAARRRKISEAEVIRQAISEAVAMEDMPTRGPVFSSDTVLADDVDTHLAGFGDR